MVKLIETIKENKDILLSTIGAALLAICCIGFVGGVLFGLALLTPIQPMNFEERMTNDTSQLSDTNLVWYGTPNQTFNTRD